MVDLTWEDIGEHIDKGDLAEWLKEERAKDKARQLADTPQTDLLVKTPRKSRESHEIDTPQTDLSTEEFVEGMKNLKMEVKQTDCGWK